MGKANTWRIALVVIKFVPGIIKDVTEAMEIDSDGGHRITRDEIKHIAKELSERLVPVLVQELL